MMGPWRVGDEFSYRHNSLSKNVLIVSGREESTAPGVRGSGNRRIELVAP